MAVYSCGWYGPSYISCGTFIHRTCLGTRRYRSSISLNRSVALSIIYSYHCSNHTPTWLSCASCSSCPPFARASFGLHVGVVTRYSSGFSSTSIHPYTVNFTFPYTPAIPSIHPVQSVSLSSLYSYYCHPLHCYLHPVPYCRTRLLSVSKSLIHSPIPLPFLLSYFLPPTLPSPIAFIHNRPGQRCDPLSLEL